METLQATTCTNGQTVLHNETIQAFAEHLRGDLLHAGEEEHEDLFWAMRGGGGNFGIVTSFEFRLHPLGPEIYGALMIYPFEETASVLRHWRDFALEAPDEVTCDAYIWGMPPLPGVPAEMHWAPVVILAGMYAGPAEEGQRLLQPLREMGTPLGDESARQPYVAMQSDLDALFADGQPYYWKSLFADNLFRVNQNIAPATNGQAPA